MNTSGGTAGALEAVGAEATDGWAALVVLRAEAVAAHAARGLAEAGRTEAAAEAERQLVEQSERHAAVREALELEVRAMARRANLSKALADKLEAAQAQAAEELLELREWRARWQRAAAGTSAGPPGGGGGGEEAGSAGGSNAPRPIMADVVDAAMGREDFERSLLINTAAGLIFAPINNLLSNQTYSSTHNPPPSPPRLKSESDSGRPRLALDCDYRGF
ncbi:hypothetical protein T492DRAFT_849164 [Pavlovales sp. CCMP2436]|nr:hypothetical protein T492DRAFT_849164 [Pavlovales sp. CCMP2436]